MEELLFGTGGTPHSSASPRSTINGIRRIAELGLGCMEVEFVRGVNMRESAARLVAEVAAKEGVRLSAHAPYYINFNAREPEKVIASQKRLLQTARIARLCGAESVVFHTAFYLSDTPEQTYDTVKRNLAETLNQLRGEDNQVCIRPEVMGKHSAFGTVDEILRLCTEMEGLAPCIDFAHWHAREKDFNSYPAFTSLLRLIEQRLGRTGLEGMHIHFSGIKYGASGEIKHLDLKDSDLNYVELLQALKDYDVRGRVICESPNLEKDALMLQTTYKTLKRGKMRHAQ